MHNLNITDIEYIKLISQGYDPSLELELMELGESQQEARKLARIVGLTKDKPPTTEEEWQQLMEIWEE
jgi:hypothetical protein